jgi:hypothetical protein
VREQAECQYTLPIVNFRFLIGVDGENLGDRFSIAQGASSFIIFAPFQA